MNEENKISCDNKECENKHIILEGELYPYDKNWIYLRSFHFKIQADKIWKTGDKHFCCLKCMSKQMGVKLKKAMDYKRTKAVGIKQ